VGGTALDLIDELIAGWSGRRELSSRREREIHASLHRLLSPAEWSQFPRLVATRRANELTELASDRQRAWTREQARIEAEAQTRHRKELDQKRAVAQQDAMLREAQEQARHEEERRRQEQERRQAEELQMGRRTAVIARLQHAFESGFLSADRVLAVDPDAELLRGPEYQALKTRFVQEWAERALQLPLDAEQAAAIAATDGDIQVVARAGSGKTRTLVTRAIFLQKHCGVSPRELLLLAFNRKAAQEMRSRLAETLSADLPHVMTFHALAHAIVHPDEELVFDDNSAGQLGLSREVQEVIDEHVRSPEYRPRIRDAMLAYFREDWERIIGGGFQLAIDEFLADRRSLPRETLKGDFVKSYGEKIIANALFEHSIEYKYERNFHWNDINYRPDFTIQTGPKSGVIIEYFGLAGDADYDERSDAKRHFWATRNEWTFLEFSPRDIATTDIDGFVQALLDELRQAGISHRRRTEEEIWELLRKRALDRFTQAMRTFVGRCRKLHLSPEEVQARIDIHAVATSAEAGFLNVGGSVYRGYLRRLAATQKDDFDGLIWRAASLIREGHTLFVRDRARERGDVSKLKFVLIDEFQDFSQMFFELADAIRSVNPYAQFFCVGDDWQAINGFAGSDIRFFENFATYFRSTLRNDVRTNYRSAKSVVAAGNALMHGRGPAAHPARSDAGSVLLCNLTDFRPSAAEQARHNGDDITPAVLRVVRRYLDLGLDVVMLARRNGLPWYISYDESTAAALDSLERFAEHVRSYLPEEDHRRVTISTAHRYKGLEQAAVIVLDAVARSYPLLHPTWIFLRVFGDSIDRIEAEERRLFYVAITRAKEHVVILTDSLSQSPYLGDIDRHFRLIPASWNDMPPAPSLVSPHFEVRVSNAYDVRDRLKYAGYRWNAAGRYWYRSLPAEGFSLDVLLAQPWSGSGVTITVYSETGELLHRRS
jgi:DNA helicase-4